WRRIPTAAPPARAPRPRTRPAPPPAPPPPTAVRGGARWGPAGAARAARRDRRRRRRCSRTPTPRWAGPAPRTRCLRCGRRACSCAPEHEGGVVAAEAEGVVHGIADGGGLHVVEADLRAAGRVRLRAVQ